MRKPDPMADNQTDQTIIALTNGSADDAIRDHATAALLASVQRLIAKTEEIERNLWKPDELDRVIDERHRIVCQACPVRKYALDAQAHAQAQAQTIISHSKDQPKAKLSLASLFSNPTTLFMAASTLISIMMSVAVLYLATGQQGFRDITNAAHLTKEKISQ